MHYKYYLIHFQITYKYKVSLVMHSILYYNIN